MCQQVVVNGWGLYYSLNNSCQCFCSLVFMFHKNTISWFIRICIYFRFSWEARRTQGKQWSTSAQHLVFRTAIPSRMFVQREGNLKRLEAGETAGDLGFDSISLKLDKLYSRVWIFLAIISCTCVFHYLSGLWFLALNWQDVFIILFCYSLRDKIFWAHPSVWR